MRDGFSLTIFLIHSSHLSVKFSESFYLTFSLRNIINLIPDFNWRRLRRTSQHFKPEKIFKKLGSTYTAGLKFKLRPQSGRSTNVPVILIIDINNFPWLKLTATNIYNLISCFVNIFDKINTENDVKK